MPRAATSVATSVSTRPASNAARAFSRWRWDLSPCMATACTPWVPRRLTSRSAPRFVRTKTRARSRSARSSESSASTRSVWRTATNRWSIAASGTGAGRCSCTRASTVYSWAIRPASPVSVADRKTVWRSRETWDDDAVDGGPEAHVEHAVGLVEHEDADVGERERAALEEVLQAAGRGDDDVRLGGLTGLALERDAAVDRGDLQRACVGDVPRLLDDLRRELAGGGEDERGGARGRRLDAVDERHAEGERLAGPRGGRDEDVAAGEDVGDDQALDCERLCDAALSECARDGIGHAEIGEGLLGQGKGSYAASVPQTYVGRTRLTRNHV